jgi:hypothetical protein
MASSFEKELDTYRKELPNLLTNAAGKFVLIKEDKTYGAWSSYEDAIQEGYRLFKLEQFLVKQITAVDRVYYFTRDISNSCQSSTSL